MASGDVDNSEAGMHHMVQAPSLALAGDGCRMPPLDRDTPGRRQRADPGRLRYLHDKRIANKRKKKVKKLAYPKL